MKRILATSGLILALHGAAWCQSTGTPTDQGFLALMRQKISETRPVVLMSPYVKPAYSMFLPVWKFHDGDRTYAECGVGGKYETESRSGSAFLGTDINLVAVSALVWNFAWAKDHVTRSKFPPIFVGPSFVSPQDWQGLKTISLKRDLRMLVSVDFKF